MKCSAFHPGGRVFFFALFAMLILALAFGILVAPFAAEAQPPSKVYRIGYLDTTPPPAPLWDALLEGLRERGYSEGRNLVFERRFSEGNAERFSEFAAEMVRLRVDCILVSTTPAALAAKHATRRFRSSFRRRSIPWARG
jgi:putative ABC transport system substrate-binding protein